MTSQLKRTSSKKLREDADVAAVLNGYLLTERPDTDEPAVFVVAKGPTPAGLASKPQRTRPRLAGNGSRPENYSRTVLAGLAGTDRDSGRQVGLAGAGRVDRALAGGYCLRAPAQGPCSYANICEHCPSFHTTTSYLPTLHTQRDNAALLVQDATTRGWDAETERHTAEWVDWFNHRRLYEYCGDIPPIEAENHYYAHTRAQPTAELSHQ